MTREEAKRTLEDLREYKIVLSDIPFNDQEKICDLAISALKGFEGMTNGEVFQAIFPCEEVLVNGLQEGIVHFSMKSNPDSMDCFDLDWWNRPYQKGGEK